MNEDQAVSKTIGMGQEMNLDEFKSLYGFDPSTLPSLFRIVKGHWSNYVLLTERANDKRSEYNKERDRLRNDAKMLLGQFKEVETY